MARSHSHRLQPDSGRLGGQQKSSPKLYMPVGVLLVHSALCRARGGNSTEVTAGEQGLEWSRQADEEGGEVYLGVVLWVTLNRALLCALEYLVVDGHVIESFRISAKRL